jgi:serine protease inhibitor
MSSSRIFKSLTVALVFSVLIAVPGLASQNQQPKPVPASEVVNGNSQFALSLYQNINAASKGQNIFVSPYSISTALAMTYAGSRNNTQKQMGTVLHLNLPGDELNAGFSSLLGQTKATPAKHYKLNVANALWGQKDYHFEASFTGGISKYYDGGFNAVDFVSDREKSRSKINKWVEDKTANKIRDLVKEDDINSLTRLILTNAIYFKGDWASKFKAESTTNEPFAVSPGKTVMVPMMTQTGEFAFMRNDELEMIELPYAGDDISMIAIVPQGDIEQFGANLSLTKLQELRKQMHSQEVNLFLPRFKFETRYYLENTLGGMGMPDAFDERKADFSGMTGTTGLFIAHVIHQAMIDVNEEGSEAAAATAVIVGTKSMSFPATFRADKPFIFMIVHKPTDSILFVGRVSNPPAAAPTGKSGK